MTDIECNSPACAIREADDAYMGYAGRDELAEALGRLLAVADEPWRERLARHLTALGAPAEPAPPPAEPVADFLRRLLPRVRNDKLHADLSALLRVHTG